MGEQLCEGEVFEAVKPWKNKIREPSGYKRPPLNQEAAPTILLEIDWVYGYRGSMCKNNIGLLTDGSIAYFSAALGIVFNREAGTQRYFDKHSDDITCIAFCKNKKIIATGENGQDPTVHIWDGLNVSPKFAV
jgi:echinoderm microtubule-associated protein-like 6